MEKRTKLYTGQKGKEKKKKIWKGKLLLVYDLKTYVKQFITKTNTMKRAR